jgi:hypothetical protein
MERKQKTREAKGSEQGVAWEARHENDAGGPLSGNASELPDRATAIEEGSPGEAAPVHGDGYQQPADGAHPQFPAQDGAADDDGDVRQRAYELWKEEGSPDGGHERHWLQAERELRGDRS